MMFARALGDPNPAYLGANAPAPPTFAIAFDHFDPDFERRPRPGEPWFGSGREAVSVRDGSQQAPDGASGFHAEERFVYHRPLRAGDVLYATKRDGETWAKQGRRGGALRFMEHVTELRDAEGEPVAELTWVDVLTERAVDASSSSETGPPVHGEERGQDAAVDSSAGPLRIGDEVIEVGTVHEQVVVDDLRRTQIVQYAGASGDFHPMHTDAPYAEAMGMGGVFAHGMLTMGIVGVALTDFVGVEPLADYRARFRGIVWPGDTLTARVTVAGRVVRDGASLARLDIEAWNQKNEPVLSGRAHARLQA